MSSALLTCFASQDAPMPDAGWSDAEIGAASGLVQQRLGREFTDGELIADAVQDALLSALRQHVVRPIASLAAWLTLAARRRALNRLRDRRREIRPLDEVDLPTPHPDDEGGDEGEQMRSTFAALGAEQQRLLRWIYIDGASYREVGVRLGLGEGQVRGRVQRAKEALRQALRGAVAGST